MAISLRSNILGYLPSFSFMKATDKETYGFITPAVKKRYYLNYKDTKLDKFVPEMSMNSRKWRLFRIHLIGHFYSQEYLEKWFMVAINNPLTRYYAYIRRDIEFSLDYSGKPNNLTIISVDRRKEGTNNTVYVSSGDELCPKFSHKSYPCKLCMGCFDRPMRIGNKPFL